MGMTITEKIMASRSGNNDVQPGMLINARIDCIMCHDVTTPPAITMLKNKGMDRVFDPYKVVVTPDHFQPAKDIKSAELHKRLDHWAKDKNLPYYYPVGRSGVCHAVLPEEGHIRPGEMVVGGDSHTCTYGAFGCFSAGIGSTDLAAAIATGELWFRVPESIKFNLEGKLPHGVYTKDVVLEVIRRIGCDGARYKAIEYAGSALKNFSMESRMTITNMAIEAGGKNAVIPADEITQEYLVGRLKNDAPYVMYQPDPDAVYDSEDTIDVSQLEPLVAFPFLPSNGRPIGVCAGLEMDQCYIGSCTNARIEDLRIAAGIIKGRQVKIRTIVVPASQRIYGEALKEGLLEIFHDAGCVVSTSTCGACLGGFMGVLAKGEKCISSTNRNFVGRMGHPEGEAYLASPATAAASAVEGKLTDPRKYL